jgi:hypothetical protein
MSVRFGSRSAMTPPHNEKRICGSVNDNVTQPRSNGEEVKSYTSQPRATICMFMANAEASEPNQSQRKSLARSELNMPTLRTI